MKLFTKDIDKKLFAQFDLGANLETQKVIAKIFNPYGRGTWYIINSDPSDPDYLWAIVDLFEVEAGSVSRSELESIKVPPFGLHLERDSSFTPINAAELYKGLLAGKHYKEGGETEQSENKEMILNQAEELEHHVEELEEAAKKSDHVPAWVVAKVERASTDLSDASHYLDAENEQKREEMEGEEEYALGGEVKWQEAEYGDSALVVSENKMGIIMKPYGRKFHLKFVDGTEKTYDANDLKFFKDMDEFDLGGEIPVEERKNKTFYHVIWDDGDKINDTYFTDNKEASEKYYKLIKSGEAKVAHLDKDSFNQFGFIKSHQTISRYPKSSFAEGGMMENGGSTSSPNSEFMKWFVDWSKSVNKYVYVSITKPNEFSSPIKDGNDKIVILDVIEKKGDTDAKKYMNEILKKADEFGVSIYLQPIPRTNNLKSQEHKNKITEDYLIKYYEKFGFENTDGGFMVRAPKMADGGMTDPMATVNEISRLSGLRPVAVAEWGDKNNINLSILLKDLKSKKIKGMDLMTAIVGNPNNKYQKELLAKYSRTKMAMGGKVKFADKVASIKASLLKRKKVPKVVQKDYGKTFTPAEAEDSAKRIVGAQTARERLMMRIKSKKKK
jgi:hypothetical protein